MSRARLHAAFAAALLVGAAALGHVAKPTEHLAEQLTAMNLEQAFPTRFGDWREDREVPTAIVSPDVEAMLAKLYAQTLSRIYVNAQGQRIMLSVAYGGDQSDATRAHRPDVCYPAQGFDITASRSELLSLPQGELPIRRMTARLNTRIEPVSFWFAVGEYVVTSGQQQKITQLKYGLRGVIPDGMLVRVSSIDRDEAAAYALQAAFIRELRQGMRPEWSARVFGKALGAAPTPS